MKREAIAAQILGILVTDLKWKPDAMIQETEDSEPRPAAEILCNSAVLYADALLARLKEKNT